MIRISFVSAGALAILLPACATAPKSILLGAGTGAAAGGGIGLAFKHDATGAAIGAATGAVTGGLIGWILHHGKTPEHSVSAEDTAKFPFLTRPEVRTLWVPDAVEGNRYIEKHRVFVIEKNSSWSKDNE